MTEYDKDTTDEIETDTGRSPWALGDRRKDPATGRFAYWDGSAWQTVANTGETGGAPTGADYVTGSANATLTAELVLGSAVIMQGLVASRPAASLSGRLYFATDEDTIYRDTGTTWEDISQHARSSTVHTGADPESNVSFDTGAGHTHDGVDSKDVVQHGSARHTGNVLPAANQDLAAFFLDVDQIAAPANPAVGTRRVFVDSADGKMKVKTSAGGSVSLEEQGGGVSFAAPSAAIDIGDAAVEGVAATALRSDSQFAFPAPVTGYPVDVAATESDGTATTPARADHGHAHGSGYSPNAHHTQSHGAADHSGDVLPDGSNQVLGTGDITISQKVAPANPAVGDRKVYVDSGTGKISVRTSGGSSVSLEEQGGGVTFAAPSANIDIGDAASEGVATTALRSDSQFAFPAPVTGYPVDVAATESDGTATTPARSDHGHAHGTGYLPDAHHAQAHALDGADHTLAGQVAGEFLRATGATTFAVEPVAISRGATVESPAAVDIVVWRAPFACTLTNVFIYQDVGTGSTFNCFRGSLSAPILFLASDAATTLADTWEDAGAVQNTAVAAGSAVYIRIATVVGSPNRVAVQMDFTRP